MEYLFNILHILTYDMEGETAVKRNVGSEESPGENGHRMSETHLLVRNIDETV